MKFIKFTNLALLLLFVIFAIGCKKEYLHLKKIDSNQIGLRSNQQLTVAWLQTFQTDLKLALTNSTPTNIYSIEEAVIGIEAIITVGIPISTDQLVHEMKTSFFQISTTDSIAAMVDLYNQSYSSIEQYYLSFDTTQTKPVLINISLDSLSGSTAYISVLSVMGMTGVCIEDSYDDIANDPNAAPCTEIFDGLEYIIGGGDEEDEISVWYTNIDCPGCTDGPTCRPDPITGPEEIENALNFNLVKPVSPDPTKPYLKGFVDVECKYSDLRELELERGTSCDVIHNYVEYCLDEFELSCIYCIMHEYLYKNIDPIFIPEDKILSNVNVFVEYCICGKTLPCEYKTEIRFQYCYGTPVFKGAITPVWDPVNVDITDIQIEGP